MEKVIFDWTECINQIKNGDKQAFVFLYSKTYGRLKKRILIKTGFNEQDSEDLLQEIYIIAYQKIGSLREPNAVLTWLETICDNTCLAYLRKYARRADLADIRLESELASDDDDTDNFSFDSIASEELAVEAQIEQKEVQRILAEIISDLPPMQCQCIELQLAEKSIKEIAQITQLPENTVKTHIFNAKKRIKAKVEELEKKGTKLYGLAPLPFFYYIFRMFMGSEERVPSNAAATASEIIEIANAGTGMEAGAAAAGAGAKSGAAAGAKAAVAAGGAKAGTAAAGLGAGKIAAIIAAGVIGLAGIGTGAAIIVHNNAATPETSQTTESVTTEVAASQDITEETTESVIQNTTEETTEETTEAEMPVIARASEAYIHLLEDTSAEYDEARNLIENAMTDPVPLWNIILKDIDGDGIPEMVYTTIESNSGSTYMPGVENFTFNYARQAVRHLVTYNEETGEISELLSVPYYVFNEQGEGADIVVGNTDVYCFDGDAHLYSQTNENISGRAVKLTEYSLDKISSTLTIESTAEGFTGGFETSGQPSENMQKLMNEGTSGCELLFGSGYTLSSLGAFDHSSAVKYFKDLAEYDIEDVTAELQSDMQLAKTLGLDTDPDRSPYNIHEFLLRGYYLSSGIKEGYYNSNDLDSEKEFMKLFFFNYKMDFFNYDLYPANVELATFEGQGDNYNYISESDFDWLTGNILNISQDHNEEIKRSIESGELSLYGNDITLQNGRISIGVMPYAFESFVLNSASITKADRLNDVYYITVKTNWRNEDLGGNSVIADGVLNLRMTKKTVDGQDYWTFLSYDYLPAE